MKVTKDTYVAAYTLAPAPAELGAGWVATAAGRSFHEGMFGLGETVPDAVTALAQTLRDALRGPAGAARGFTPDRFTRIVLMAVTEIEMAELPTSD